MIKSGAVFVFSAEESGIKQWTGRLRFNLCSLTPLTCLGRWTPLVPLGNSRKLPRECYARPFEYRSTKPVMASRSTERLRRNQATTVVMRSHVHRATDRLRASRDVSFSSQLSYKGLFKGRFSNDQDAFKLTGLIKKVRIMAPSSGCFSDILMSLDDDCEN